MSWRHVSRSCTASVMFLAGSGWRVLLVEVAGAVHSEEGNSHGLMWSGAHTQYRNLTAIEYNRTISNDIERN